MNFECWRLFVHLFSHSTDEDLFYLLPGGWSGDHINAILNRLQLNSNRTHPSIDLSHSILVGDDSLLEDRVR